MIGKRNPTRVTAVENDKGSSFPQKLAPELITESSVCAVCLLDLDCGKEVAMNNCCEHLSHFDCLKQWSEYQCSCPQCKLRYKCIGLYKHRTFVEERRVRSFRGAELKNTMMEFDDSFFEDHTDPCYVCGSSEGDDREVVLCDGMYFTCNAPAHLKCLGLTSVPKGMHFCQDCVNRGFTSGQVVPKPNEVRTSVSQATRGGKRASQQAYANSNGQGSSRRAGLLIPNERACRGTKEETKISSTKAKGGMVLVTPTNSVASASTSASAAAAQPGSSPRSLRRSLVSGVVASGRPARSVHEYGLPENFAAASRVNDYIDSVQNLFRLRDESRAMNGHTSTVKSGHERDGEDSSRASGHTGSGRLQESTRLNIFERCRAKRLLEKSEREKKDSDDRPGKRNGSS